MGRTERQGETQTKAQSGGHGARRREHWLSLGFESLIADQAHGGVPIDVLIVGSGYGGAIAADRLTQAMVENRRRGRLVLLERGREYLPGAFPLTEADLAGHLRFNLAGGRQAQGRREGLLDVRIGRDMHVVLANGLGGGSLTNAGVMETPHPAIWKEPAWPQARRDAERLQQRAQQLQQRLMARPIPAARQPARTQAMLAMDGRPAAITVAHQDQVSSAGVALTACIHCGDCASGCNHGAKISLDVGPLKAAHDRGLQIYCGASVSRIRQAFDGTWEVQVWHTDATLRGRMQQGLWIRARHLILAAGTLGSTEILLRSRSEHLAFSHQLGRRFSGNGDVLAAVFDSKRALHGMADEEKPYGQRGVGPTITAMLDRRTGKDTTSSPRSEQPDLVVQDLGVPAPLARLFAEGLTTSALLHAMERSDPSVHREDGAGADPCAVDPAKLERSLSVAIMVRDDAQGVLRPNEDDPDFPNDAGVTIDWPHARQDPRLLAANAWLQQQVDRADKTASLGGQVLPNPLWRLLPAQLGAMLGQRVGPLLTVHPLGGCAMADSREHGVVDACGRVFDGSNARLGTDLHDGLYVLDGAMVPTSLGINPALTIATLVDLAMDDLLPAMLSTLQYTPSKLCAEGPAGHTHQACDNKQHAVTRPIYALPPKPKRRQTTDIQVLERLAGIVDLTLNGTSLPGLWMELDLVYQAQALWPRDGQGKRLPSLESGQTLNVAVDPKLSRLRIFPASMRGSPFSAQLDDRHALLVVPVAPGSQLRFLRRESSTAQQRRWRALPAWFMHRGLRDCWQSLVLGEDLPWQRLRQAWHLASHAGAARRFDYEVLLQAPSLARGPFEALQGIAGLQWRGHKRLIYQHRAHPLTQLSRVEIDRIGLPDQPTDANTAGVNAASPQIELGSHRHLNLDLAHLAAHRMPLLRVVAHQNQPTAIFDIASYGLYLARVLTQHHLWSLRKPDPQHRPGWLRSQPASPQRLPGTLPGLPPPVVQQFQPEGASAGEIRLTHYPHPQARAQRRVVLMVHGYSASGTTFAHPTVAPNLTTWLHRQGYEPWIVDLRTSCGMPTATQPWRLAEIADQDLPAAIEAVCTATGLSDIHLITHCMGSALLTLLLQQPPQEAGLPRATGAASIVRRLRSWTMSQVGPRLVYAPANQLRIMLLDAYKHRLRGPIDLIDPPMSSAYQTPGEAFGTATLGPLIDRVVALLPYGDIHTQHITDSHAYEFDVENPSPWRFWRRTPWTKTRHRLDALIGRTFDARQMRPETLARIDDFFGPFNLATMTEPMAYHRYGKMVRSHEDDAPDLDAGQKLRGVPLLSLHGARNGLADPQTAELLQTWRHQYGLDLTSVVFAQHGHQDLLIGRDCTPVFQRITGFLQRVDNPSSPHANQPDSGRRKVSAARLEPAPIPES